MAGLTTEQINAMGAKSFTGSLSDSQMTATGAKQFTGELGAAQGALGHSQSVLDQSRVFTSPLQQFASGDSQDVLDHSKGALVGLAQGIAPAGAQNAGPIGQGMLDASKNKLNPNAPSWAEATQMLSDWKPANTAQAVGQGEGSLASLAIPGEAGLVGGEGVAKTASPFLGTAVSKLGEGVQSVGKSIYKFFLPQSEKESALLRTYKENNPLPERIATAITGGESTAPKTMADTAFQVGAKGTEGQMGVTATRAKNTIWKDVLQPAFNEADKTHKVSMNSFFDQLQGTIAKENPEPSRQKALLDGLEALREDYKGTDLVKPSQLDEFKQAWAEHLPNKAFKGQEIGPAFNQVKNLSAQQARTGLYDLLGPDAKEAFFDHGNLQQLEKLADAETAGKNSKLSSWESLKDKALVPISTIAGRTVYRIGQGIELVGESGARTLGDLELFKSLTNQQTPQPATESQTQ